LTRDSVSRRAALFSYLRCRIAMIAASLARTS
jgi:hypothetical protein